MQIFTIDTAQNVMNHLLELIVHFVAKKQQFLTDVIVVEIY